MLPRDIPGTKNAQGPSSLRGTFVHVKGHLCRPTRHPETLRDSPRRSATTSTHEYWNLQDRHLIMRPVSPPWLTDLATVSKYSRACSAFARPLASALTPYLDPALRPPDVIAASVDLEDKGLVTTNQGALGLRDA